MQKHLCFHLLSIFKHAYKIDYALKTQKWKAMRNRLAIYDRLVHARWNTNYIAHV